MAIRGGINIAERSGDFCPLLIVYSKPTHRFYKIFKNFSIANKISIQ
jgi:hypothetical protein